MNGRMVYMTEAQYAEVESLIEALMRAKQTERAALLMNLSLSYRFAAPAEPVLPDNVVELHGYSRKAGA